MTSFPLIDALTGQPVVPGGSWALGNFDGIHLGHQAVIRAAVFHAEGLGAPPRVLTFEPHPYALFQKENTQFRLTPPSLKDELLRAQGVTDVVSVAFTPEFAALSPRAFIDEVLIKGCGAQHVAVGFDFVFGQGRGGDRQALRDRLGPRGIGVTEVPPCRDALGEIISSSRVRAALRQGHLDQANALLGRPYTIRGTIQKGAQRGRTIDFPTANIDMGEALRPLYGVYAVRAHRVGDGMIWPGVANIGLRPTVDGTTELLEFHLFDFRGSLYGDEWDVELHHILRPEHKFESLEALKAQIVLDALAARTKLGVLGS